MGTQAENNQFYKGRREVIDDYEGKYRSLRSGVAGQNFMREPGFLYEAATILELQNKQKLSDLNYKITAEAIKRELTQTGHEYDIAYKNALIAFELNKSTLLNALEQEFADLKHTQKLSEEEVDRQFIELEIRKLILITTKTEIDLEKEGLRQDLEETKRLTMDKEVELANQKVITANKKLELIPYIEQVIAAEQEVLTAEEANIPYLEEHIEKKQELAAKKKEIIPYIIEKSEKLEDLAEALIAEIDIKRQIAAVAILKALLGKEKVDKDIAIIEAKKAAEALRLLLVQARIVLRHLNIDWDIDLTNQTISDINELSEDGRLTAETIRNYDVDISGSALDAKDEIEKLRLERNEESTETSVDSDVEKIGSLQSYRNLEAVKRAQIMAAAKITTNLMHILGTA